MSLLKMVMGMIVIVIGIVLMYQGPFNNVIGSIDELIERPAYLMGTVLIPVALMISGGYIIKKE